jgi:hydrogenase nickel incorporation protein HypB
MSTTEGEDKPLKYPSMFRKSQALVLNKVDLLPHLTYDIDEAIAFARQVNPGLAVFRTSCTTGDGIEAFAEWLLDEARTRRPA